MSHAEPSLIGTVNEYRPAFVKILGKREVRNPQTGQPGMYVQRGAGAIIDSSGIIVTNAHVLANTKIFEIILHDGSIHQGKFLSTLPGFDIILIQIELNKPLATIKWGDSDFTYIGEEVVNIGNAYLNDGSISVGHVRRHAFSKSDNDNKADVFEVTIPLYDGDSGGPLLNRRGELVGMVSAKNNKRYRSIFAIASNKIRKHYLEYLKQKK